jgi:hypothetical protein
MKTYFFAAKIPNLKIITFFSCFSVKFSIPHEKSISSRCSLDLMRSFFLHLLLHFGGAKHCGNDFIAHVSSLMYLNVSLGIFMYLYVCFETG